MSYDDYPKDKEHAHRMYRWIILISAITLFGIVMDRLTGCSRSMRTKTEEKVVTVQIPVPPPASCEGLDIGQTRDTACENGVRREICTLQGLSVFSETCHALPPPPDECVAYEEVRTEFADYCSRCHAPLATYDGAKTWGAKVKVRTALADADPRHMPPVAEEQPDDETLAKIGKWVDGGAKELCDGDIPDPPKPVKTLGLDYIESVILRDLSRLDDREQKDSRYLVASHRANDGGGEEALAVWEAAANKAINHLNTTKTQMELVEVLDAEKSIYRFQLNPLGLKPADWKTVEATARLKAVSDTDIGKLLRQLTGTDSPWLWVESFIDSAHGNAQTYYKLTRTPPKISDLQKKLGVNFAADIAQFDSVFAGGNSSPISLHKNRLLVRINSASGYYWQSFDPVEVNGNRQRVLVENPLLVEAGGVANFSFDASEVIYTLPNGLQAYALFNAQGVRQDAAPLNIVSDNRSPISPEIKTAGSCHRCHSTGILPMADEIRDAVLGLGSQAILDTQERVRALYPATATLERTYRDDAAAFVHALGVAHVPADKDDPMSVTTDRYQLAWTVDQVAAFVFLSPADFRSGLGLSQDGLRIAGQLLTGGTITFGQLVDLFPIISRDLRLFQDPLGG